MCVSRKGVTEWGVESGRLSLRFGCKSILVRLVTVDEQRRPPEFTPIANSSRFYFFTMEMS